MKTLVRALAVGAALLTPTRTVVAQVTFTLDAKPADVLEALKVVVKLQSLQLELGETTHALTGISRDWAPPKCAPADDVTGTVIIEPRGDRSWVLVRADWITPQNRRCMAVGRTEQEIALALRAIIASGGARAVSAGPSAAASTDAATSGAPASVPSTGTATPVTVGILAAAEYGRVDAEAVPTNQGAHFATGLLLGPLGVLVAYISAEAHDVPPPPSRIQQLAPGGEAVIAEYQRTFSARVAKRRQGAAAGAAGAGFGASIALWAAIINHQASKAR